MDYVFQGQRALISTNLVSTKISFPSPDPESPSIPVKKYLIKVRTAKGKRNCGKLPERRKIPKLVLRASFKSPTSFRRRLHCCNIFSGILSQELEPPLKFNEPGEEQREKKRRGRNRHPRETFNPP